MASTLVGCPTNILIGVYSIMGGVRINVLSWMPKVDPVVADLVDASGCASCSGTMIRVHCDLEEG